MEFWKKRKQVLVDVVNEICFSSNNMFSSIPLIADKVSSPNEQCYAFSAMIYYVHIIGDHSEGDNPDKLTDIEPLIQYTNMTIPGIIPELRECLQVVFASQETSWTFLSLDQKLTSLCIKAEQNCGTWGAVDTLEKCEINQELAKELLEILSQDVPILISKEEFFTKRFKAG